jgi:hypothetical protein
MVCRIDNSVDSLSNVTHIRLDGLQVVLGDQSVDQLNSLVVCRDLLPSFRSVSARTPI